ncbi:MAG: type II toxin-antitoxin system prevent-host-death family antitoxin [Meiothermus sp.]
MSVYNLNEVKTHLSALVEAVRRGEEITITRYGKAVAKLVPISKSSKVRLGFRPLKIESDFLEPTDPELIELFYSGKGQ